MPEQGLRTSQLRGADLRHAIKICSDIERPGEMETYDTGVPEEWATYASLIAARNFLEVSFKPSTCVVYQLISEHTSPPLIGDFSAMASNHLDPTLPLHSLFTLAVFRWYVRAILGETISLTDDNRILY